MTLCICLTTGERSIFTPEDYMKTKKKKLSVQAPVSDENPLPSETTARFQNLNDCQKFTPEHLGVSWYDRVLELPAIASPSSPPSLEFIRKKQSEAELIYQNHVNEHNSHSDKPGGNWLDHVIKSGTVADRLAAHSIKIQNAPLYSIRELKSLVRISASDMQRNVSSTLEALKDLFVNVLLPPSRKLIFFHKRPLNGENVSEEHLVYWFFEHTLKSIFLQYLNVMEEVSQKSVLFVKCKILNYLHDMLIERPEQEHLILSRLLNRYTDKNKKLSSSNTYLFMRLLERHPKMGILIVKEVEIYFYVFRRRVELNRDYHSRILNALLTGIDRAIPFVQLESDFFSSHLSVLFKIVHVSEFGRSTRTLTLLFNVMKAQGNVTDRFYRALYRKLCCPDMSRSSKKHHFLDLVYRAMVHDKDIARVKAFVKRCAQVCLLQTPECVCAFLLLLSNIIAKVPGLTGLLKNGPETKVEKNVLAQTVGQIEKVTDSISNFTIPRSRRTRTMISYEGKKKEAEKAKHKASSIEDADTFTEGGQISDGPNKPFPIADVSTIQVESYDPSCRDPRYSNADCSALWELNILTWHYHPQVCKWAKMLLECKQFSYLEDVFSDFSVYNFTRQLSTRQLDQFLSKSRDTAEKCSEVDNGAAEPFGWIHRMSQDLLTSPDEEEAGVDTFFYKYFVQRKKLTEQKLKYQKMKKEFKKESAVDERSSSRVKLLAQEDDKCESSSDDEELDLDEDDNEAESDYEDFEISDDSESSENNDNDASKLDSPVAKTKFCQNSKKDKLQSKNTPKELMPTPTPNSRSIRPKRPASSQKFRKTKHDSNNCKEASAKHNCHKRRRSLQD
ncbi:CCAAT/enhancer-binding protein zeta-like [Schistocerca gregaria]|uniref:CCAAT/enhancer-binding protein zeta-like n=1 Tax=Schistocerca gregaria TaxID=7010 RepID=UPI00211DB0F5|nr:CCAAT/enhancer-binding protein zeta-like [Schistocerca gregaria]